MAKLSSVRMPHRFDWGKNYIFNIPFRDKRTFIWKKKKEDGREEKSRKEGRSWVIISKKLLNKLTENGYQTIITKMITLLEENIWVFVHACDDHNVVYNITPRDQVVKRQVSWTHPK